MDLQMIEQHSVAATVEEAVKGASPFYCTREYWQGVSQNVVGSGISFVLGAVVVIFIERAIAGKRVPLLRGDIPGPR